MTAISPLLALAVATLVSGGAWRLGALTTGGAVAATAIGTAALRAGLPWAALLLFFFVSSSALSQLGTPRGDVESMVRGGARNAVQVLANGAIFAVAAVGSVFLDGGTWAALGAGAMAAATADTWSTEAGTRWGGTPRHILRFTRLPTGASGGVTLVGSAAALAGALLTSAVAYAVQFDAGGVAIVAGGLSGTLADSVLGATVQERRWCDRCGILTERPVHTCGASTRVSGGLTRFDNDAVNFTSIGIGALVTCLLS